MNLFTLLKKRDKQGKPIRVGLIGAGKFGTMFLSQAQRTKGIQIVGIADLRQSNAANALLRTGWVAESMASADNSNQINDLAAKGLVGLTEDSMALIASELDVIVESTGIVEAGVTHALAAIEAGHHIVMVNVETDCCVGPLLYQKAQKNNLVYSMAYGDQPALICEMVDWARTCGFEVVAAGKGTKYLPDYHYSTPDTVWEYYGFTSQQITKGDFNTKMFNSFLDGTKSAIEMSAVADATGLIPQPQGLSFPPVGVDRLAEMLKPKQYGGILSHSGTVEVVSCVNRDGSPVARDLRWGVYVTYKANSEYVKSCFEQYGVIRDSSGEYGTMYRPVHLIGFELGISVASAAIRHEPTGCTRQFIADVSATAKRDLSAGEVLDGEGGYMVYGKLLNAKESLASGVLPMGLASDVKLKRPVAKDKCVCYNDVEENHNSMAWKIRREMEQRYVNDNRTY